MKKLNTWIETKRLVIKPPALSDLDDWYAIQSDSDVMCYVGTGVRTREMVKESLLSNIQHEEKHNFSLGSVFLKDSGKFIGRAGLIYLACDDTQPDIEVGYMLHKAYWNNGYATELTQACLQWGFENLAVNKLVAVIQPKNEPSRRVLEKCGMCYIGQDVYHGINVSRYEIYRNDLDISSVQLLPASREEYSIVKNMAAFYVYDISKYMGRETDWEFEEDGTYSVPQTLNLYWEESDRYPFIIRVNNELAGFVLINKIGSAPEVDWNMGEFFIAGKFQKRGLGKYIAQQCFDKFHGVWEVMVIPGNEGAYRFWRSTIKSYTKDNFKEYTRILHYKQDQKRNIFNFQSKE